MKDLVSKISAAVSIAPLLRAASVNGTSLRPDPLGTTERRALSRIE